MTKISYPYATAITAIAAIALRLLLPNESNPLIQIQSGLQASLKPAQWIPKIRDIHRYEMDLGEYSLNNTKDIIYDIRLSMEQSELIPHKIIQTSNGYIMEAYYYTPSTAWLDVVTLNMIINKQNQSITINGIGESTGILPLTIPMAPILNMILCWAPFDDWGNNRRYLVDIQRNIQSKL